MTSVLRPHFAFAAAMLLLAATVASATLWKQDANGWLLETTRDAGLVLNDLRIVGLERTREQDLLAVLDVDDGMPLLAVDLASLQHRIEALPWVKQAVVSRQLPGGLSIAVSERKPYALLQQQGRVTLIDNEAAEITDRGLAEFRDLPLFVGPIGQAELAAFGRLSAAEPALTERVTSAVRVGERRWDLIFDNGIRAKLPADAAPGYDALAAWQKLARLDADRHLLAREVSVIDLRVPDRLIVRVTPAGRRQMQGREQAL